MSDFPPNKAEANSATAVTRREMLRLTSRGVLGLTVSGHLPNLISSPRSTPPISEWGKAKSVVFILLKGGPSHIDLWDPKENAPDSIRSPFKAIPTKIPGVHFTEILPGLARINDKLTLIRSMSYHPNGLFYHDAGIYQSLTGYPCEDTSPSGRLPLQQANHASFGAQIIGLKSPLSSGPQFVTIGGSADAPALPANEAAAGAIGPDEFCHISAHDLETQLPTAIIYDGVKGKLTQGGYANRCKAAHLIRLRSVKGAIRERYGNNVFGQSMLLARQLVASGTRIVTVEWPWALTDRFRSWDTHDNLRVRIRDYAGPIFDRAFSAFILDLDSTGLLDETLVVALGEFGRAPKKGVSTSGNANSLDGRDHWPYCYSALIAGAGIKRGYVHGASDATGSTPVSDPVHPSQLFATIYQAFGIASQEIVHDAFSKLALPGNATPVTQLFT